MTRSSKKGPWVEDRLLARIEAMNAGALDYLVKGEITPRMMNTASRLCWLIARM